MLFVRVENACRSQMAEAWFNHLAGPEKAAASSAGTALAKEVNPGSIEVMKEARISMEGRHPKLLTPEMNEVYDYIVTMGCIDECPITQKEKTID